MDAKSMVERSRDAWNARDRAGYLDCYAQDCEFVTPLVAGKGHEAVAAHFDATTTAAPDGVGTVVRVVVDGNVVVVEAEVAGTNTGVLQGHDGAEIPATGRSFVLPYVAVHTVADGKITSSRFYWNGQDMLGQLGLLPN